MKNDRYSGKHKAELLNALKKFYIELYKVIQSQ